MCLAIGFLVAGLMGGGTDAVFVHPPHSESYSFSSFELGGDCGIIETLRVADGGMRIAARLMDSRSGEVEELGDPGKELPRERRLGVIGTLVDGENLNVAVLSQKPDGNRTVGVYGIRKSEGVWRPSVPAFEISRGAHLVAFGRTEHNVQAMVVRGDRSVLVRELRSDGTRPILANVTGKNVTVERKTGLIRISALEPTRLKVWGIAKKNLVPLVECSTLTSGDHRWERVWHVDTGCMVASCVERRSNTPVLYRAVLGPSGWACDRLCKFNKIPGMIISGVLGATVLSDGSLLIAAPGEGPATLCLSWFAPKGMELLRTVTVPSGVREGVEIEFVRLTEDSTGVHCFPSLIQTAAQ